MFNRHTTCLLAPASYYGKIKSEHDRMVEIYEFCGCESLVYILFRQLESTMCAQNRGQIQHISLI